MREFCTSGSVGGAAGNCRPYPASRRRKPRSFLKLGLRGSLGFDCGAWGALLIGGVRVRHEVAIAFVTTE